MQCEYDQALFAQGQSLDKDKCECNVAHTYILWYMTISIEETFFSVDASNESTKIHSSIQNQTSSN